MNRSRAVIMLIFDAALSGFGYILLEIALQSHLSPALVVMLRGVFATALCFFLYHKQVRTITKREFWIGTFLGILNFIGFILTTVSMELSTPSNTSFLLSSGIILVPFIDFLFHKKRPSKRAVLSAVLGIVGIAILSGIFSTGFVFNFGNLLAFLGAVVFSLHITFVGKYATEIHHQKMVFFMMFYLMVGGFIYALFVPDSFSLANVSLLPALLSTLGLGIGASFMYFLIQVTAQMHVSATTASLVLSSDALFTSVLSILFGFEQLTPELVLGGLIITAAIILLEMPIKKRNAKAESLHPADKPRR